MLLADHRGVCAAIYHQERRISWRPSSIRACQHGCDICGWTPPQGLGPVSMSPTSASHRIALQMRLLILKPPKDKPGNRETS